MHMFANISEQDVFLVYNRTGYVFPDRWHFMYFLRIFILHITKTYNNALITVIRRISGTHLMLSRILNNKRFLKIWLKVQLHIIGTISPATGVHRCWIVRNYAYITYLSKETPMIPCKRWRKPLNNRRFFSFALLIRLFFWLVLLM